MPRFSVPGIGSFVWHVERAQVDPKAGIVLPPRPTLKYEPGHRYQSETIMFIQEYFGMPADEAEALLREIGRVASNYVRATNEIDLWKLGKIKKVGAIYKVELANEAPIAITAELYEVSLRATTGAAVAPPPVSSPAPEKRKPEKPSKTQETQEKSKTTEQTRARVVERDAEDTIPAKSGRSSERRWTLIIVVIGVIVAVAAVGVFWLLGKRKTAQPVEISLSKRSSSTTSSSETSDTEAAKSSASSEDKAASARKSEKSEAAPSKAEPTRSKPEPAPQPKAQTTPPAEKPAPSPPPTSDKPKPASGPRYHIIVGAYPSRAEAEAKAKQFSGYAVQYLPGKDPGWVRLSVFNTTNKGEAQRKLQEIRAQAPDAWVLTAQ